MGPFDHLPGVDTIGRTTLAIEGGDPITPDPATAGTGASATLPGCSFRRLELSGEFNYLFRVTALPLVPPIWGGRLNAQGQCGYDLFGLALGVEHMVLDRAPEIPLMSYFLDLHAFDGETALDLPAWLAWTQLRGYDQEAGLRLRYNAVDAPDYAHLTNPPDSNFEASLYARYGFRLLDGPFRLTMGVDQEVALHTPTASPAPYSLVATVSFSWVPGNTETGETILAQKRRELDTAHSHMMEVTDRMRSTVARLARDPGTAGTDITRLDVVMRRLGEVAPRIMALSTKPSNGPESMSDEERTELAALRVEQEALQREGMSLLGASTHPDIQAVMAEWREVNETITRLNQEVETLIANVDGALWRYHANQAAIHTVMFSMVNANLATGVQDIPGKSTDALMLVGMNSILNGGMATYHMQRFIEHAPTGVAWANAILWAVGGLALGIAGATRHDPNMYSSGILLFGNGVPGIVRLSAGNDAADGVQIGLGLVLGVGGSLPFFLQPNPRGGGDEDVSHILPGQGPGDSPYNTYNPNTMGMGAAGTGAGLVVGGVFQFLF